MNATGIPIAYHAASSLAQSLGDFYAPAEGLKAQFEAGADWDLGGEADESAQETIGAHLAGVVFGVAAQIVEEGVADPEDIDRGALVGLRWAQGPFGMMNALGPANALKHAEAVSAQRSGFVIPELLREHAAKKREWRLRDVRLSIDGPIATITMSRPEAMNALNGKVLRELQTVVVQLREDPVVRVVILTGSGPAFVAGADIRTMLESDTDQVAAFTRLGQEVLSELEALEKPVIAAINGFALGGGLELALACDIRLASEGAQLGFPEVGLGIFPGFGGTQRATRLIGKGHACELIFSGDPVDADTASRIGLVNRVLPAQELLHAAEALAQRIASRGPLAVAGAKRAINRSLETGLEAGLSFELDEVLKTFGTKDQKEGMSAFLERRKPEFTGQ
jgi:enoyl-CoA hydratase